ncbi:sensor histidine kinase [Cohnella candidum]|nr:sensor histidine kinase [Cohnella candidum]
MRLQSGWKAKWGGLLLAVVLILLLVDSCSVRVDRQAPKAEDGVLDLSTWDWSRDGAVSLAGTWDFEWLGSNGGGGKNAKTSLEVPGMWRDRRAGDGSRIPDVGYGEYHLKILHPDSPDLLAIRVPNISTAYQMYINGKLVLSRGHVGPDSTHTTPYQLPGTAYVTDPGPTTDIRLVVANYHHRLGGIRTDLIMGSAEQIDRLQSRNAAQEFIVFGCLLMIGLYHIGLFALRRSESANLFFAMLCLLVALRMGVIGEGFLVRWFDILDWQTSVRLEYAAFVLSGWAGLAYYHKMYPDELRGRWVAVSGAFAAVLAVSAALLQTIVFTSWLAVYQVYLLTNCIIILAGLVLSGYRKREGAKLALVGVAGMVAAIVNDMLFYNGWWRSVDLVPFGLLFLIIMNSFIIAMRSSRTFERAEQMSAELKEWNDRLEERIAERTEELSKSYETLEETKTGLERMEQSRRQLVSNISHDLRTPITLLQGYLEALRDGVISDDAQRDSTIRLMLGKVEGLNGLIHDLFELSVLEARRVELSCISVTLEEWKERLNELYELDMKEKGMIFSCALDAEEDACAKVLIDAQRMDRVFANLLFNAVRYTPQGGLIRIVLRRLPDLGMAEISVEDSGSGIDPDDLPFIFDRFYKKDKSRHSSSGGSGLGLAISREIVELHGGTIGAFNRPEGGGAFRIRLPMWESRGAKIPS